MHFPQKSLMHQVRLVNVAQKVSFQLTPENVENQCFVTMTGSEF